MMTPWSKLPNRAKADGEERASLEALVEAVIGAAYEVSNILGAGFVEKVYERALLAELKLRNLPTATQAPFSVVYKGKHVGVYTADLVVADRLRLAALLERGREGGTADGRSRSIGITLAPA